MGTRRISGPAVAAIFAFFAAATGTPARSQTIEENAVLCANPNPETRLKACTELLSDGADVSATDVYNNRGQAYSELGQTSSAIRDFDRAIEAWPSNAHAYSNRGLAYNDLGQPQRAIEDFDNAIKADPKSASAYNNRCYVLSEIGRPKDAISDCEQALKLAPGDAKMLDTLGYVRFRLGEYSPAIDAYDAALKVSPGLAVSLYARGVAKERLGDAQGNNDMRAAIEIDRTIGKRLEKVGVTSEMPSFATAQSR